ncbi:ABC transporter ATP-binding protein [Pseudothermotoga sp. U03pept]|uniref:ABC transporter ATP-binding protein n=1 Tax=Pseudothermotoga sp. U03pept TaxID=3447012 RepID=UPI003F0DAEB4
MSFLQLVDISVGYQKDTAVLKNFNLSVEKGQFLSLLGPSGCGKTTTLRLIAGFLTPTEGKIIVNKADYTHLPAHKRKMGIVFQNYALFPHMNVFQNIAFGLKMRKLERTEIERRVKRAIAMVGLQGLEDRLPAQLSGGQQQRVGIARAIVIEPDLLLMDEPLSNLDANLRLEMRNEIRRIQQELGITTVYVTHDQSEAIALSDRVAVMNQGKIEQLDSPQEIFFNPKSKFVARFMGFQEIASGVVKKVFENHAFVLVQGRLIRARFTTKLEVEDNVTLMARSRKIGIETQDGENRLPGIITAKLFQGENLAVMVSVEDKQFVVEVSEEKAFSDTNRVFVHIASDHLIALKEE